MRVLQRAHVCKLNKDDARGYDVADMLLVQHLLLLFCAGGAAACDQEQSSQAAAEAAGNPARDTSLFHNAGTHR
jgi:hypothetical protein